MLRYATFLYSDKRVKYNRNTVQLTNSVFLGFEWKGVANSVWILPKWQRWIRIESRWSRLVRIEWKTIPDFQWLTSLLPSSSGSLARSPQKIQSRRSQHYWRVSSNPTLFWLCISFIIHFEKVRTMEFAWTRRRSLRFRHWKWWLFTLFGLKTLCANGQKRGFVCNLQAWSLHLCWMGLWRITKVT